MKRLFLLTPAIIVLASCATQQAHLTIGDPAPALAVSDWVKGEPVEVKLAGDVQQPDQDVVVLEFWATWCGPCVASIPHVTEMQQAYKDKGVRIVGVTALDDNNTLEMVEDFVKEQGDAMDYGVAFDRDGKTYKAYMKAAGQNGIPTTFHSGPHRPGGGRTPSTASRQAERGQIGRSNAGILVRISAPARIGGKDALE